MDRKKEFLNDIRGLIRPLVELPNPAFEEKWQQGSSEILHLEDVVWENVSLLSCRLEFLRHLCKVFETDSFRENQKVTNFVLSGTAGVGDVVCYPVRDGVRQPLEIVERRISQDFSVIYRLKSEDGQFVMHELKE